MYLKIAFPCGKLLFWWNIQVPFVDKPFSNLICLHIVLLFPSVEGESLLYGSNWWKPVWCDENYSAEWKKRGKKIKNSHTAPSFILVHNTLHGCLWMWKRILHLRKGITNIWTKFGQILSSIKYWGWTLVLPVYDDRLDGEIYLIKMCNCITISVRDVAG